MADLDAIAESLRRQRRDLDEHLDETARSSNETAKLLGKIEELRRRAEETQRLMRENVQKSDQRERG